MELVRTRAFKPALLDEPLSLALSAPHAGRDDQLQLFQLLALTRRRLPLILACGLAGAALVFGAAHHMQKFSAKALVLVEPLPSSSGGGEAVGGAPPIDEQSAIETHILTMLSEKNLDKISASFPADDAALRKAVDPLNLQRQLKIQQELHSRVISVTFADRNATVAADVVNRVAEAYVSGQRTRKHEVVAELLARMHGRVTATLAEIEAQRRASPGSDATASSDLQRRLRESLILEASAQRQQDTVDRDDASAAGLSILSAAGVPSRPSTGSPLLLAAPALVACAIAGFFLALVLERSDRSLRSEQQTEEALGVPCYSLLPRRRGALRAQALKRCFEPRRRDPYAEAIKSLLLDYLVVHDGLGKVVLLTSALDQEGKTSLAVALATGAASLGRKALVVDLDWRGPARRRAGRVNTPTGLLDMLDPAFPAEPNIEHVAELDFDRLGVGRSTADACATLASRRLQPVIERLRANYDLIILDGPSLLGNAEAQSLAVLADLILLAVRWGGTRREFVQCALNALSNSARTPGLDIGRVGAVLTGVRLRRHALYRFGDRGEVLSHL